VKDPLQIVWLKRDLRAHDHPPLAAAVRAGATIALYVYEPSIVRAPDFDAQHLDFINGALAELETRLGNRGVPLCYRHGELPEILEQLYQEMGIAGLWAHEETGNALSYARDRRVRAWAKQRGIPFREFPHSGVVRRLQSRDGWAEQWEAKMRATVSPPPRQAATIGEISRGRRHDAQELGVRSHALRTHVTLVGERAAHDLLQSFLSDRGRDYRREMSSPISAPTACSRLSPHFTWGTMSVRQAYQAAHRKHEELAAPSERAHRQSIESFISRLAWRDHFIQKLESEPAIEYQNFARAYDDLRPREADPKRLNAWLEGRTGYPFVDACMRYLRAKGWINFRMRAMLVSFASYHLWLDWRATSIALAPHFIDYEPGIHYSQFQMQSGTTGINTIRIYNPYKQGLDQDPDGVFIRHWVPELAGIPSDYLHTPHELPPLLAAMSSVPLGHEYPPPIVDHARAYALAKERMHAVRAGNQAKAEADRVQQRHGSRKLRPGTGGTSQRN
jgi:deoxyribodipyrimidine photo-lyase